MKVSAVTVWPPRSIVPPPVTLNADPRFATVLENVEHAGDLEIAVRSRTLRADTHALNQKVGVLRHAENREPRLAVIAHEGHAPRRTFDADGVRVAHVQRRLKGNRLRRSEGLAVARCEGDHRSDIARIGLGNRPGKTSRDRRVAARIDHRQNHRIGRENRFP